MTDRRESEKLYHTGSQFVKTNLQKILYKFISQILVILSIAFSIKSVIIKSSKENKTLKKGDKKMAVTIFKNGEYVKSFRKYFPGFHSTLMTEWVETHFPKAKEKIIDTGACAIYIFY